jgi:hypothetical protein
MEQAAGSLTGPRASGRCSVSTSRASGTSCQPRRAGPISARHSPPGSRSTGNSPAMVRTTTRSAPRSSATRGGDAARRIAAGAGLGPVRIQDAHEDIRAGGGRLHDDELVAADSEMTVRDSSSARGRYRQRGGAPVQHDEVVAEAVHLAEGNHNVSAYRVPRGSPEPTSRAGLPVRGGAVPACCHGWRVYGLQAPMETERCDPSPRACWPFF